jgi:hypothetical protein
MISPTLTTLGKYLAGEFENSQQAIADPAWYVNLRLWQRPVPLFREDSITLYAEQANILKLDYPYRPRIIRLREAQPDRIQVDYYMLKQADLVRCGGSKPQLLASLTQQDLEFLPSCTLDVRSQSIDGQQQFTTTPATDRPCTFTSEGKTYRVFLGFTVTATELLTFDKGISTEDGSALWGAIMGPFRYRNLTNFALD